MSGPLPPNDYTSRDWSALVDLMLGSAATLMPEWTNRSANDFGVVLIEAFAYMGDVLNWYIDRTANESFIITATQRNSILALAAQLDYVPNGAAAASAVVTLTLPSGSTLTTGTVMLTIPTGTQFGAGYDSDGQQIVFENPAPVVVTAQASGATQSVSFTVVQGEQVTAEAVGTSCGEVDESYSLLQTPVIDGSIVVYVQESPSDPANVWTPILHLLDAAPTDNVYTTSLDSYGGYTITFGDNVNGRIPPRGSVITADYRVGGGEEGNAAAGEINDIIDPTDLIAGSDILPTDTLTLVNTLPATGGADPESIESIRSNAPLSLTTLRRAVGLQDHASLALQVPTVAKASAQAFVYTNVLVHIAPVGGGLPSDALISQVAVYLGPDKLMAGTTVTVATPDYIGIDVSVTVAALPTFSRSSVQVSVQNAIANLFAFDSVSFGQYIGLSDIYQAITAVPGVAYGQVTLLARHGGSGVADVVLQLNELPIAGTVTLTTTGGTDAGSSSSTSGPSAPTASGAPVFDSLTTGSSALGIVMHWAPSSGATALFVQLDYLNSSGTVVRTVVLSPTTSTTFNGTASFIGDPTAVNLRATIQAYNGTNGPVLSATTTVPYNYESTHNPAPTGAQAAPTVTGYTSTSSGVPVSGSFSWTAASGTPNGYTSQLCWDWIAPDGITLMGSGAGPIGSATTYAFSASSPDPAKHGSIHFYVKAYNGTSYAQLGTVLTETYDER